MTDLLIAAAIDLSGGAWFTDCWQRVVNSLALGKAGNIAYGEVPGAGLAYRAAAPLPEGKAPRLNRITPQARPDGSYILLAGRIMDRSDLASRFGLRPDQSHADTYASLYEKIGDDCDNAITGDYAVIQWFPRTRRLRLARSPISMAPLHVWRQGERILVASLPRTILAGGVPAVIDDRKVADMLLLNLRDGTSSWYDGIQRVVGGSVVHHDQNGSVTRHYWTIDTVKPVHFKHDKDYVEAVDEQFHRAIRANLEDVKRPAILLSGGFDSQAVASYAVEHLEPTERLRAFTAVPMQDWQPSSQRHHFGDESAHVRALAEMYPQIDVTFVDGAEARFGERLDAMFLLGGCPTHNELNLHWAHEALERAAAAGCDAILTGDAGNPGFSYDGLTGYPTWLREGQWLRLLREVRMREDDRPSYLHRLVSMAVMPNLPLKLQIAINKIRPLRPSPFKTWCPIREEYAAESGAMDRAQRSGHDITFHRYASARDWRAEVIAAMSCDGPEIGLGLTLLHGIGDRDPTAYRPLLELCMGIPDEQYLRDGESRWLARRLLRGRVPEMVRTETRRGDQSADWAQRMGRETQRLLAEMSTLQQDPRLAAVFDFDRMISNLRDWDGTDFADEVYCYRLNVLISRGISTARFVRYVEGRNAG